MKHSEKHSPTPWRVVNYDHDTEFKIVDANDETVALASTVYPECIIGIDKEDAQRIVACVNMAEGVPTKELLDIRLINNDKTKKVLDNATNLLEIAIAERDKERAARRRTVWALEEIRHYDDIHAPCWEMANRAIKQVIKLFKEEHQ